MSNTDLRSMLMQERFHEAVHVYGNYAVKAEIEEMTYDDLADVAHKAAKRLGYTALAELAKTVLQCSGAYVDYKRQHGI